MFEQTVEQCMISTPYPKPNVERGKEGNEQNEQTEEEEKNKKK